jgi:sensor histidine kinase YesM
MITNSKAIQLIAINKPFSKIKMLFLQKLNPAEMTFIKKYQLVFAHWVSLGLAISNAIQKYVELDFNQHYGIVLLSTSLIYCSMLLTWLLVFSTLQPTFDQTRFYPISGIFKTFVYCGLMSIPFAFFSYMVEIYFAGGIETPDLQKFILLSVLRLVFELGLAFVFKYSIDSREVAQKYLNDSILLREANVKAQFEILKQQINPHFLFNALSTLKSLIRLQDSNAEIFVMNLSDMYRKLLQRREKELIRLSDEMEIVNAYLFMQKLRFENNLIVKINIPETAQTLYLPPFALQLLIENTIKHNIISQRKPLTIYIFSDENRKIVVENTLQPKRNNEESTGWGLTNLIERYAVFTHTTIDVIQTENIFSVALPLLSEV